MPDPFDTRIAEIGGRAEAATERHVDCTMGEDGGPCETCLSVRELRADIPFLLAALHQARQALVDLIGAYEHATEHITKELQPEFEKLAETGTLTWRWPNKPYDQSQAAWRLATWWHGVGTDERLERARAALAPEQTKGAA